MGGRYNNYMTSPNLCQRLDIFERMARMELFTTDRTEFRGEERDPDMRVVQRESNDDDDGTYPLSIALRFILSGGKIDHSELGRLDSTEETVCKLKGIVGAANAIGLAGLKGFVVECLLAEHAVNALCVGDLANIIWRVADEEFTVKVLQHIAAKPSRVAMDYALQVRCIFC